jgi:two-component system, NarL family, nitrate/nitrite response regulator NarL
MASPQLMFASNILPRHSADPLRVVVASDNPLRRASLMIRLAPFADLEVSEVDAPAKLRGVRADAVVSDSADVPRSDVPLLRLVADASAAADAIAHGARGVLLLSAAPRRIHTALRAITDGLFVVDDELETIVPQARGRVELIEPLTPREHQVAQLLVRGLTNKEIAARLEVTEHTVKFHLNGLLRKLGVSTRTEAVVQAARLGVVVL